MANVIVIGVNHHNTLSMVRALGAVNGSVDLFLLRNKSNYVSKSKYVKRCVLFDTLDEITHELLTNLQYYKGSVIISCSDEVSYCLDNAPDKLWESLTYFRCNEKGEMSLLMDKQKQLELAEHYHLAVPKSIKVTIGESLNHNIPFPCIVKPAQSYSGGKHLDICSNESELITNISHYPNGLEVLVQQKINKIHEIVLPGLSLSGDVYIPGVILKHRESVGATTRSTVRPHDKETLGLANKIIELIKGIGYEGLFGVEFIYDGTNYYFIELNLRNDATCYSLVSSNINLAAIYASGKNLESKLFVSQAYDSIVEFNDFGFVLRREISIFKWMKDLRRSKCKFYYDYNDIKPFWGALAYWLKNWTINKVIK